jgi:MFS family permease
MLSATYSELLRGNKNFRRLWTGQMISELGTWFSFIAELGLVRMISGSPLATTALLVARLLPFLLVAPVAGVFVDRKSRKRIMIWADLLRAAVALLYIAAVPLGAVWVVIVCSVMMSSLSMFFEAAKNAAMPNMVGGRELLTANVLMYSTRFLQFTLGAAFGGLTAAQFGYNTAFIINSLSFVGSAVFVFLIPAAAMRKGESSKAVVEVSDRLSAEDFISRDQATAPQAAPASSDTAVSAPISGSEQPVEQSSSRFFADLREGLAYIWATPFVRGVILVNVGWATGGGMTTLIIDQMGGRTFAHGADRGDWNVAALFTAGGAGLFIGMMLARKAGAWVGEPGRAGRFIGWCLLAQGALLAASGLMPSITLTALWMAASRLILGMEFGVQETLMMRVLPDAYRGRVFTTDRSIELSVMALSSVVAGWLMTWLSPSAVMVVSGLLSASPGVVWLLAIWLTKFSVPACAVRESFGD